ncbi:MAG TPA: diguanylate cyclase [Solirubrobacterales bacterium]|nr:diguanylate cyclase [Solirubrobacterales bacterium]
MDGSPAGRLALEVSAQHVALLAKLREELGDDPAALAEAAQRLAAEFGPITATAVEAAARQAAGPADAGSAPAPADVGDSAASEPQELTSLYQPGHMRRRLNQLIETNRRYGHPFGLAVFDASGPGTRSGSIPGGEDTVLAILGAALRDSVRLVDEAFRLEEAAICVLAPNLRTVEGVQMAERLLGQLDELERAGGLRIAVAAGVVACPDHGADADGLLSKADAALWRARAVGQPVGVGALEAVQDR